MSTPMQRFIAAQAAEKSASAARKHPDILRSESSLHVQLVALDQDVKRLREFTQIAERISHKRDVLLPRWEPVARDYLASGQAYDNPVLVYCIIWLLDVRRLQQGLDWTDIAISQGQKTPDNIKSSLPTFVAGLIYDWTQHELENGRTPEPFFSRTFKNVTENWTVHEKIVAKYYRLYGLTLLRDDRGRINIPAINDIGLLKSALVLLKKSREFFHKSPVKTAIDRTEMRLRYLTTGTEE